MRRIAVVCTARPSYSKLKPVLQQALARGLSPILYAASGMVLDRFGHTAAQALADFPFVRQRRFHTELDGHNLVTSAKSTALVLLSLADAFAEDQPEIVLVNHDRREVLAAAQAAAYQNIPVAHIGGGEISGNIDDKVRNAITALSDVHFVSNTQARDRVLAMGAHADRVHTVGCPSVDVALAVQQDPPVTDAELGGSGPALDLTQPFLLVLQHSETERPEDAFRHMSTTLHACQATGIPLLVMWPGNDAGLEGGLKAIRIAQQARDFRVIRSLPPERFLRLLGQAWALVGNSSAGIREASVLPLPVVNVGERQRGRLHGTNVITVPHNFDDIRVAITRRQKDANAWLYGRGHASRSIVDILEDL